MTVDRYELVGSVRIDGKLYRTVRIPAADVDSLGQFDYSVDYSDEPPYTNGIPSMVSDPEFTWHLGGFKSRQGVPGASEYGKNTDDRWAFRMLPSALIHDITLTGLGTAPFFTPYTEDGPVLCIFETLGYIFAVSAKYVWRINPADDTVILSHIFNNAAGVMGVVWETAYPLFTQSSNNTTNFRQLTAINTPGPDTYVNSPDVDAIRLAVGINRLFKVSRTGVLKNIVTGLDPVQETNWADQVQVGDPTTIPTALLAYDRTVFVGKPEGFFGVGDDGFGLPLIKRMPREVDNCYGMINFDPWVLVPYVRGLYWFQPGLVEAIGLERELLNESPIHGRWKGFATDGQWIYGLMTVGTDTYINVGRERTGNESGFGKIVWDTWLFFTGASKAIFQSALTTTPRLWFGKGTNLSYVKLSSAAGSEEYAASGSRYLTKLKFDDWGEKDFPYIDLVGKNLSSTKYWIVNYSVDGGAYSDLDADGAQMKISTDGRQRFFFPATTVGREIQVRLDYANSSTTVPPELNYIETFAVPQSRKIPLHSIALALETGIRHDHGVDTRSSMEQLNDLLALIETPSAVETSGPWGDNKNAWIKKLGIVTQRYLHLAPTQSGNSDPSYVVQLLLQLREES